MIVQYKIIVDTQDRSHPTKNKKTYLLNIDELLTDGTDSDKLVITKDNDYVLRYFKASEFNVMSKLDTPYKEPIDININLFEGTNFVYIENITGEDIYAEYIIKNDFTDVYVTKNTMNSTISESIDKIELSISQKLTDYSKTNDMDDAINTAVKKAKDDINSTTDNKLKDYATTKEMNAAIKLSTDGIEQKVSEKLITYSTTDEMNNAIGIAKNDVNSETDNKLKSYPIVEEMNSSIKQTAKEINLEVSKKVGNDEVISKINQSAEKIQIDAKKISLVGKEINLTSDKINIASTNFNVDKDGKLTCSNANVTGTITSSNATITGGSLKVGKNFSVDKDGNVNVANLVTTGKGVYTNIHINSLTYCGYDSMVGGFQKLGFSYSMEVDDISKDQLIFYVYIPTNFTITEAYINLIHVPILWRYLNDTVWGYTRNIGLYKGKFPDNEVRYWSSEPVSNPLLTSTKINMFADSSNWHPENGTTTTSSHKKITTTSQNIGGSFNKGPNIFILQSDNSENNLRARLTTDRDSELATDKNCAAQTGKVIGFLDIYGYLPR